MKVEETGGGEPGTRDDESFKPMPFAPRHVELDITKLVLNISSTDWTST